MVKYLEVLSKEQLSFFSNPNTAIQNEQHAEFRRKNFHCQD
jgi:hypothetical protein